MTVEVRQRFQVELVSERSFPTIKQAMHMAVWLAVVLRQSCSPKKHVMVTMT